MDEIAKMMWRETNAKRAGRARNHAWVEFRREGGCIYVEVNGKDALRLSIKYQETGPYLAVEESTTADTGETMGACKCAGEMARRYAEILEAHNALGERLGAARTFIISPEEKARAASAA